MTAAQARRRITRAFRNTFGVSGAAARAAIPPGEVLGKLYEAFVLATVAEALSLREGLRLVLKNDKSIALKTGGGPINRSFPFVEASRSGIVVAELWTDVHVTTLSCEMSGFLAAPRPCDYHELDIVMVPPGSKGRPRPAELLLAVECKATTYQKSLLREILGVRRELSLLTDSTPTSFTAWPRSDVPARPASCLLVYSTDSTVNQWQPAGDAFGIDFIHCEVT